jgi:hypothetical protein
MENNGDGNGATGGGYSSFFASPTWQNVAAKSAERGVPDVAGDADPNTGYVVRVDGQTGVIGGTSAVAPLWAGLRFEPIVRHRDLKKGEHMTKEQAEADAKVVAGLKRNIELLAAQLGEIPASWIILSAFL